MYSILFQLRYPDGENKGKLVELEGRHNKERQKLIQLFNDSDISVHKSDNVITRGKFEFYLTFKDEDFHFEDLTDTLNIINESYLNKFEVAVKAIGYQSNYVLGKRIKAQVYVDRDAVYETKKNYQLVYSKPNHQSGGNWLSILSLSKVTIRDDSYCKYTDFIAIESLAEVIELIRDKVAYLSNER